MTFVNERSVLAVGVVFIVLGIVAVAARFFVRRKKKNELGIDDWLCLPALVSMPFRYPKLGLIVARRSLLAAALS